MDISGLRTGRFFFTLSFCAATVAVTLFFIFEVLGKNGGSSNLLVASIGLGIGLCIAAVHLYAALGPSRQGPRPWLAPREWRERRIVCQGGVRDFYFALGVGVFGCIAVFPLILIALGLPVSAAEPDPGTGPYLLMSAILVLGLLYILYAWRRQRKFGLSYCTLETLPGVIGGWFKATVEVTLPVTPPPPVTVTLINSRVLGKVRERVWETSSRVLPAPIPHSRGDRYQIPVRIRIPDGESYVPWNRATGQGWMLQVTANLPGLDLFSAFPVPIFKTDEAPPEEQRPE